MNEDSNFGEVVESIRAFLDIVQQALSESDAISKDEIIKKISLLENYLLECLRTIDQETPVRVEMRIRNLRTFDGFLLTE